MYQIREVGNTIALYSDDPGVISRLKTWKQLIKTVPYTQNNVMVGADLYFPLHTKNDLARFIKKLNDKQLELGV